MMEEVGKEAFWRLAFDFYNNGIQWVFLTVYNVKIGIYYYSIFIEFMIQDRISDTLTFFWLTDSTDIQ